MRRTIRFSKRMRRWLEMAAYLALAFAMLGVRAAAQGASASNGQAFVVVVNADNPITAIDRDELSRMFLKRVATWPNGSAAEPVDLPAAEPSRIAFSKVVHKKPVNAVRAFWQQQIFSGRDIPPVEESTEANVVSWVSTHVGGVGYVSSTLNLAAGVKIIDVQGVKP